MCILYRPMCLYLATSSGNKFRVDEVVHSFSLQGQSPSDFAQLFASRNSLTKEAKKSRKELFRFVQQFVNILTHSVFLWIEDDRSFSWLRVLLGEGCGSHYQEDSGVADGGCPPKLGSQRPKLQVNWCYNVAHSEWCFMMVSIHAHSWFFLLGNATFCASDSWTCHLLGFDLV